MALAIAFEEVSQQLKREFWTRREYRHLQLAIVVRNPGEIDYDGVAYEALVPESLLFNVSGDRWGPINKREVDGVVYDVWEVSPENGGIAFPHNADTRDGLELNLHPQVTEVTVLGRVYIRAEPIGDYARQTFRFEPFVPFL